MAANLNNPPAPGAPGDGGAGSGNPAPNPQPGQQGDPNPQPGQQQPPINQPVKTHTQQDVNNIVAAAESRAANARETQVRNELMPQITAAEQAKRTAEAEAQSYKEKFDRLSAAVKTTTDAAYAALPASVQALAPHADNLAERIEKLPSLQAIAAQIAAGGQPGNPPNPAPAGGATGQIDEKKIREEMPTTGRYNA